MGSLGIQQTKLKRAITYIRNVYTSIFAAVAALVFSYFITDGYVKTYNGYEIDLLYPVKVVLITCLPIAAVATVALVYNYFDNLDLFNKREYFESGSKKPLISRPQYIVCFVVPLLLSTVLFAPSFHKTLVFFFPEINIAIARFLAIAVMATMRLVQLWSLQDKWQSEKDNPLFMEKALFKRNRDMYLFKPRQIILQPIGYFFAFGALSVFVGYVAFPTLIVSGIISAINIIMTPEMWWVSINIPAVIVLILILIPFIYNTAKRRKLIKKLKQIQREGLGRVEIKGRKYLSATLIFLPLTVKITDREGEVYNCIVATCGEINAPMFFKENEYLIEHGLHMRGGALMARGGSFAQAVDISQMGGKDNPTNLVFGFRSSHMLNFPDTEGHKVVILNPTPTTAFAMDSHSITPIDTGERIGDYTLFTTTGLFNHIERQSRKGRRDFDY